MFEMVLFSGKVSAKEPTIMIDSICYKLDWLANNIFEEQIMRREEKNGKI